jgi:hypothetical protein
MNTPAVHHPRLVCRLVRGWLSVFGDASAAEGKGLGAAHLESCEDCQRFFSACNDLESALRRDVTRHAQSLPEGMEQRIIRAVHQSKPEPRRNAARHLPALMAGAVACVALAVIVFRQNPSTPRTVAPDKATITADQVWTSLKPKANDLLSGDPLQHEVDAMVSDARSAVRFLERNFLPPAPEDHSRKG